MKIEGDFYLVDEAADANLSDTASLDDVIPEVWSRRVRDYFDDALVVAQLMDVEEMSEGDQLHIPKWVDDTITIDSHTEGADVTVSQMTDTVVTVTPATKAARIQISDQLMRRTLRGVNVMERAAQVLGRKLAEDVEDIVIAELQTEFADGGTHDARVIDETGTANVTAELLKGAFANAKKRFMADNVPGEYFCVMRPEEYELLLGDSQFTDASVFGGREAVLNGEIARYLGIRVLISNKISRSSDWDSDSTNDFDTWFIAAPPGRQACTLAYLARPRLETQRRAEFLTTEVIASMDVGTNLVYPECVVRYVHNGPA